MNETRLITARYLNAERFKAEVFAALFGVWWGGWVIWGIMTDIDPLRWFPGDTDLHMKMSAILVTNSLVHAIAVRGNGRWGVLSPALRLLCFIIFTLFFLTLALASTSTGFATYTAIAYFFAYSTRAASGDLYLALKGYRYA